MQLLHDDLLTIVFDHVPQEHLLHHVALVCKHFGHVIKNVQRISKIKLPRQSAAIGNALFFWPRFCMLRTVKFYDMAMIVPFCEKFAAQLEKMSFGNFAKAPTVLKEKIATFTFDNLKKLHVSCKNEDAGIAEVAVTWKCPQLQQIKLVYGEEDNKGKVSSEIMAKWMQSLKGAYPLLKTFECNMELSGPVPLVQGLTWESCALDVEHRASLLEHGKLKSVELYNSSHSAVSVPLDNLPTLVLHGSNLITELPLNLRKLSFVDCKLNVFPDFQKLTHLRDFVIQDYSSNENEIKMPSWFAGMHALRSFCFQGNSSLVVEHFSHFATNLQEIWITKLKCLDPNVSFSKSLCSLFINESTNMKSINFASMNLSTLLLCECETAPTLNEICAASPSIEILQIYTMKVSPSSILNPPPLLRKLCLGNCSLTAFPMEILALSSLQHLELNENNITSIPSEFETALPNLRIVNLVNNEDVKLPNLMNKHHLEGFFVTSENNLDSSFNAQAAANQIANYFNFGNSQVAIAEIYGIEFRYAVPCSKGVMKVFLLKFMENDAVVLRMHAFVYNDKLEITSGHFCYARNIDLEQEYMIASPKSGSCVVYEGF